MVVVMVLLFLLSLLGNGCKRASAGAAMDRGDAKHYFCFFLDPGSVTFKKLFCPECHDNSDWLAKKQPEQKRLGV